MARFKDRREAGQLLAQKLSNYANDPNLIVVALPRGGVPVGFEVAKALNAPLDILVVRKLGMPRDTEVAMGAIANDESRHCRFTAAISGQDHRCFTNGASFGLQRVTKFSRRGSSFDDSVPVLFCCSLVQDFRSNIRPASSAALPRIKASQGV